MKLQEETLDREYIKTRINNWKERLAKLYDNIENWAQELGELEVQKKNILQFKEELMYRFDVEPESIPTIAIHYGIHRVSLVPMALWVLGANGRLNITTNKNQYILVDIGISDTDSRWVIVDTSKRGQRISLNKVTFLKLIKDEGLFE